MAAWFEKKIPPMLARPGQPFDSKDHLFEIKWDGIRAVAFVGRDRVRLQSRKLTDSTRRYPELVAALLRLGKEAILDGEIVALERGKPSFERILERQLVKASEEIALRARQIPAIYAAFDLLYLDGRELFDQPLIERRRLLSRLLEGSESDALVESSFILERGKAYYREAVERGLEGVVAKSLESPYEPGKRTAFWIKIKASRTQDCVVLATVVEPVTGRVKSLALGAYREGALVWVGNVGSGLDQATLSDLGTKLAPLAADPPPGLVVSAPGQLRWLKPALVVRVKYLELTRERRLRAPVFVGFVDAPPESCTL